MRWEMLLAEQKKCTRHDQNILCALIVQKGSESTVRVAACNMSGLKIKLVDKVPAGKAGVRFCRDFLFLILNGNSSKLQVASFCV